MDRDDGGYIMRDARTRIRDGRGVLAGLLLGGYCLCGWGCHHHYYYYGASAAGPCPPAVGQVISSNVAAGPVCEVPSEVDGGTIVGSHSTVVDDGRGKARVVVSKPDRRPARLGWRSSNPEDVPAFTQIDGAVRSTVR
jgi:hypothetical protein